jgi:hypothetical protein
MAKKETQTEVEAVATDATKATSKVPKEVKPTRAEKIAAIVSGHTYELVSPDRVEGEFICICGGKGKRAYVALDEEGTELKVGGGCLPHLGLEVPKVPRKSTRGPKKAKRVKKVKAETVEVEVVEIEGAEPAVEITAEAEVVDDEFDFLNVPTA